MRAAILLSILLSALGQGSEDSGSDVMGVKIKRYGRDATEGRASIDEDHNQRAGTTSPPYRSSVSSTLSETPGQRLPHPLGEGLVYPKRKPITFW